MSGDPLSRRTIVLQRRDLGATTWVTIATMGWVSGSDGSYAATIKPTATADYRLFFDAPSYEGLRDATSSIVRVEVGVIWCPGSTLALRGHRALAPAIACV
jgi:hypothetical protein